MCQIYCPPPHQYVNMLSFTGDTHKTWWYQGVAAKRQKYLITCITAASKLQKTNMNSLLFILLLFYILTELSLICLPYPTQIKGATFWRCDTWNAGLIMQYKISAIVNNSNTASDCRLEKLHETGKSWGEKKTDQAMAQNWVAM